MLVECLGGCAPVEDLSGPRVELGSDGLEVVAGPSREVGAFREVLAQQPVGVLFGAALPGAAWVGEERRDAGLDGERGVGGEFFAAVPGERTDELVG